MTMKVLGVDIGLRTCGYVIATVRNLEVALLKEGEIKPDPKQKLPQKLGCIFEGIKKEILEHKPEAIIIEKLYSHHRHPTTLGVLAQVMGVVVLLSYQEKIALFEYSPTRARKSFLGRGNANSQQVKKMAENITGKQFKSLHTADAYSLVIAYSHAQKLNKLLNIKDSIKKHDLPS